MAAPWEKYAKTPQAEGTPWAKYGEPPAPITDAEQLSAQKLPWANLNTGTAGVPSLWEGGAGVSPTAKAAVRGGAQGLLMGYEPQVVGGIKSLGGTDYVQSRNAEVQANEAARKESPYAYGMGELGGGIAPMMAMPEVGALKNLPAMAKGAGMGAGMGLIQNPGDTGESQSIGDFELKQRAQNAAVGGVLGAGLSGAGQVLSSASQGIKNWAGDRAVKAAGFIQSSLKKLSANMTPEKLGQEAMDLGLVKAGDTVHTIAEKANTMVDDIGEKIGKLYDQAKDEVAYLKGGPEEITANRTTFLNQMRDAIKKPGTMPVIDKAKYNERMEGLIHEIALDGDVTDPRYLFNVKRALQQKVRWWKTTGEMPENERGYKALQRVVNDGIGDLLDTLGHVYDTKSAETDLAALNKQFAVADTIATSAEQGVLRDIGNRYISPSSYGMGMAGGLIGASQGHGMADTLKRSAIFGAIGASANKLGMKFGPAMTAESAYGLGKGLANAGQYPGLLGGYGGQAAGAMSRRKKDETISK